MSCSPSCVKRPCTVFSGTLALWHSGTSGALAPGTNLRDTHSLHPDRPRARSIELGDQDALPLAQDELSASHLQCEAMAEQHRAEVRVGVHPIAIRMRRVVVH